jgi:hypothetical protein
MSELPADTADDTSDDTPSPDGHLHSVGPSHERHKQQLAELEKNDEDAEGDLPNELLETAPPSGGTMPPPDPADLAHPPTSTPRQTVAPSFW